MRLCSQTRSHSSTKRYRTTLPAISYRRIHYIITDPLDLLSCCNFVGADGYFIMRRGLDAAMDGLSCAYGALLTLVLLSS